MTLAEKLRRTRELIISRGGFGAHISYLNEAIEALESGIDIGDMQSRLDRVLSERDAALAENARLKGRVEELLSGGEEMER